MDMWEHPHIVISSVLAAHQAADLTPLHLKAVQLLTATTVTGETQYFTELDHGS
jgi:hypothetical protein